MCMCMRIYILVVLIQAKCACISSASIPRLTITCTMRCCGSLFILFTVFVGLLLAYLFSVDSFQSPPHETTAEWTYSTYAYSILYTTANWLNIWYVCMKFVLDFFFVSRFRCRYNFLCVFVPIVVVVGFKFVSKGVVYNRSTEHCILNMTW